MRVQAILPSVLPLACGHPDGTGALGLSTSFAPRRYLQRTPRVGTGHRAQARNYTLNITSVDPPSGSPLVSCDLASHRPKQQSGTPLPTLLAHASTSHVDVMTAWHHEQLREPAFDLVAAVRDEQPFRFAARSYMAPSAAEYRCPGSWWHCSSGSGWCSCWCWSRCQWRPLPWLLRLRSRSRLPGCSPAQPAVAGCCSGRQLVVRDQPVAVLVLASTKPRDAGLCWYLRAVNSC